MSILRTVQLKNSIEVPQILEALLAVNRRFPYYRLGYSLNIEKLRWERVEENNLKAHLSSLIEVHPEEDLHSFLASKVVKNNDPLKHPLHVILCGNYLSFKMQHSFGDGLFLTDLMHKILFALHQPLQFNTVPEVNAEYWLPIWRILWQETGQALSVLSRAVFTIVQKVLKYQRHATIKPVPVEKQTPLISKPAIEVVVATFSPEILKKLNDERKASDQKVSLNTWMQVLIASRLQEMGHLQQPVVYTIPIDLRRYLKGTKKFYPGNLSTQVQVTINEANPIKASEILQAELAKRLQTNEPLAGIPVEWLVNLAPRKVYERLHRNWILHSRHSDPRFFVFTNIGSFNPTFDNLNDFIAPEIFSTIPIMDTPMVIAFNTYQGQGNLCASYDPTVISRHEVETVLKFE